MGAGSAALIWYACCCSFVAFVGIIATGLIVYGRQRELRARSLPLPQQGETTAAPEPDRAAPPSDPSSE